MAQVTWNWGPFLGEVSGLDPRAIGEHSALVQNLVVEAGWVKPEYGFRNLSAIPSGLSAVYGLNHLLGYTSAGVEKEEYVSVETRSGNTRPYSIHPTTGVRTEIKNGVSSVSLNASDWKGFAWDDTSYWFNPAVSALAKHNIGDASHWLTLQQPATPTGGSGLVLIGAQQTFAGFGGGSSTFTGAVSAVAATTSRLSIQHSSSTTGAASVTFDTTGSSAGNQDLRYQDVLEFNVSMPTPGFRINPASFHLTELINAGATSLTPTSDRYDRYDPVAGTFVYTVFFDEKVRADYAAIDKFKWSYTVTNSTGTAANNLLEIYAPNYARIDTAFGYDEIPDFLQFGYTFYNSVTGIESDIKVVLGHRASFDSARTQPAPTGPLNPGVLQPYLQMGSTADPNVDKIRIYLLCNDGAWHRIGEQNDTDNTFDIQISHAEALALPDYVPAQLKTDNVLCAAKYKEWVVWGYKGRFTNIRHSRVAEPEKQASGTDTQTDTNKGRNFTLRQDDPVNFIEADDALIIFGTEAIWAQVPSNVGLPTPSTMTAPKRLPGSKGCVGAFQSCRWVSDSGYAGGVGLDKAGNLWLAVVSDQFDGESGFQLEELSAPIRGQIDSFLRAEQGFSDYSSARLDIDSATDSLWITMGKRAFELTARSLITGKRMWKRHSWTMSTGVKYLAFSTNRRMRWIQSTGEFDENKWNSSSQSWIEGSNRHGGSAMPTDGCKISSAVRMDVNSSMFKIRIKRDTLANTSKVMVVSSRQTQTYTIAAGMLDVRCSQFQQGHEHQVTLILAEGDGIHRGLEMELHGQLQKNRIKSR